MKPGSIRFRAQPYARQSPNYVGDGIRTQLQLAALGDSIWTSKENLKI